MNNFSFFNDTKIHFGKGQIAKVKDEITADARVLITYGGGSIKQNGILQQVQQALTGMTTFEFGGIEANPHFETLINAVEIVKKEKIDFLLAVGGGSVIDGTKFIAAAAKYAGDPWQIVTSFGQVVTDAIPLGCVLTLAATGSEMNPTSVITKAASQDKLFFNSEHVRPRFSILDPQTTLSLPKKQVANGVVDSFVHVVEQYMTYPINAKVQDRFAEGLLQTLIEEGPMALSQANDYQVRANLMWTATMALNGLIATGVPVDWSTHIIGQELTALYGLDHAQTLAIVLPALWQYKRAQKAQKLLQYAERVWHIHEGSEEQIIDSAIAQTKLFFESMGLPTRLSAYGLNEDAIQQAVSKLTQQHFIQLGEHQDITPADAKQILTMAL